MTTGSPPQPSPKGTDENICLGCGLCCDGVLYDRAPVAPGEESRMIAAGLDLIAESGENKVFRLPCPQSNCGSCMIYETRFEICRTFECALLGRAQKGELSLPEAQEKVAIARGLLAKVVETDPEAKTLRGRNEARARLAEQVGNRSEHERAAIAHRLLAMVALETFLQRWFRHRGEKTAPEELPTMTSKR